MTTSLERRYRRLLRAYPAAYRRRRGDELLATLLEAAAPRQRRPTLRETLSLLGGGLSARAGVAGGCTPWTLWAEGLRLGALLLLVSMTSDAASATWLQTNHLVFTWISSTAAGLAVTVASAAAVAAVARGAFRPALVLLGVAVAAGWSGLRYPPPPELWAYLTAAGILAVLAVRPPANPRRRAWPWLLATPLPLVVGLYGIHFPTDRSFPQLGMIVDVRTLLPVAALLLAVLLWLPVEPRPAIAAAVYIAPTMVGYLQTLPGSQHITVYAWLTPLAIATVTGTLLAASAARAHHLSRL